MDVQSARLLANGLTELVLYWCAIFLSPMLVYVCGFLSPYSGVLVPLLCLSLLVL